MGGGISPPPPPQRGKGLICFMVFDYMNYNAVYFTLFNFILLRTFFKKPVFALKISLPFINKQG